MSMVCRLCDRYDTIAEGIGNDHVTGNFGKALLDDAFKVSDQEAVYMAHYLLKHEGTLLLKFKLQLIQLQQ